MCSLVRAMARLRGGINRLVWRNGGMMISRREIEKAQRISWSSFRKMKLYQSH
jgi:hypothetical protein